MIPQAMITPRAIALGAVSGAAAGSLVGLVANRMFRRGEFPVLTALLVDAVLGAVGFVGGAIGIASLPALESITTTHTVTHAGGMIIRSTVHHYDNAYRLALIVALLLVVIFEFIRYRIKRSQPSLG
jgi:hypothetical protein